MGMAEPAPRRPGGDVRAEQPARFGGAGEAMHAVSRLLGSAIDAGGPSAVADILVTEARRFFRVSRAILLSVAELEGRSSVAAMSPSEDPPGSPYRSPSWRPGQAAASLASRRSGSAATEAAGLRALGAKDGKETVLLLPMRVRESVRHVLVLADAEGRDFQASELEVARAFADAAEAGLAQLQLAAEYATQTARQAALARAARSAQREPRPKPRPGPHLPGGHQHPRGRQRRTSSSATPWTACASRPPTALPKDVIGAHINAGEGLVGQVHRA